ncbi:hypothetical protein FKM82_026304 [Ascaphus truei]
MFFMRELMRPLIFCPILFLSILPPLLSFLLFSFSSLLFLSLCPSPSLGPRSLRGSPGAHGLLLRKRVHPGLLCTSRYARCNGEGFRASPLFWEGCVHTRVTWMVAPVLLCYWYIAQPHFEQSHILSQE